MSIDPDDSKIGAPLRRAAAVAEDSVGHDGSSATAIPEALPQPRTDKQAGRLAFGPPFPFGMPQVPGDS